MAMLVGPSVCLSGYIVEILTVTHFCWPFLAMDRVCWPCTDLGLTLLTFEWPFWPWTDIADLGVTLLNLDQLCWPCTDFADHGLTLMTLDWPCWLLTLLTLYWSCLPWLTLDWTCWPYWSLTDFVVLWIPPDLWMTCDWTLTEFADFRLTKSCQSCYKAILLAIW